MIARRNYMQWAEFKPEDVTFALSADRAGKPSIIMMMQPANTDVAIVTPACLTNWPRVTGDGNYGTMWGPTDIQKAKFSLDLTDASINGGENPNFAPFAAKLDVLDDKLLDFVHGNQLKLLGRKNLAREEVKMLQIRTVRPKYDKMSGQLIGHSFGLTTSKYAWDGMGGKFARPINICDKDGTVIPNGNVAPGDVVAATSYANMVYTGVGGDKFGIHWSFEDVSVICQRSKLEIRNNVPVFGVTQYEFGSSYDTGSPNSIVDQQFSD